MTRERKDDSGARMGHAHAPRALVPAVRRNPVSGPFCGMAGGEHPRASARGPQHRACRFAPKWQCMRILLHYYFMLLHSTMLWDEYGTVHAHRTGTKHAL